jgi:glutamyl-tRNA reductase
VIVVVGLNHETAPVAVREAMAFPKDQLGLALERAKHDAGLAEVMILSTCNRVEVYGRSEKNPARAVADFLARYHGRDPQEIEKHSTCSRASKRCGTPSAWRPASTRWCSGSRRSSAR